MRTFVVLGNPVPQPRHQVGRRGAYIKSNHPIHAYKDLIRLTHGPANPLEGPVSLSIRFVLPRPASKSKQLPSVDSWHFFDTPDIDNLVKSVMDALNGLAWIDDRQVCDLHAVKIVAGIESEPKTIITVGVAD